ncbi:toll/interleukin-1 receptor domain-containing protein [Spirosoma arcticum]
MEANRKTVFISYTWETRENPEHREWVRKLADDLSEIYGIFVLLDQYELALGKSLTLFMERSIEVADKVLSICTPIYKKKAMTSEGGVGYEHSLITAQLYDLQAENDKFIAVLRQGTKESSIPGYLKTLVYQPMERDDLYEAYLLELAQEIYGFKKIKKPTLGSIPDFDNLPSIDPITLRGQKQRKRQELERKKELYLQSQAAIIKANAYVNELINTLEEKVKQYTEASVLSIAFSKSDRLGNYDKCVLYTDIGYCILILWFPDNGNLLNSKFRLRYYKGNIHHDMYGRISLDSPNPVFSPDQVFSFTVDDNLESIWCNTISNEFFKSDKLIKSIFVWVLDRTDEYDQKRS